MKFQYTVTVHKEAEKDWYPAGSDPIDIEKQNAVEVIIMALEDGEANVTVERMDSDKED